MCNDNLCFKYILDFLKAYGNKYALLIPINSEYFFEYTPDKYNYVKFLTGFTGSNAKVLFSYKCGYFFTDSRYTIQAKNEIDTGYFKIIDINIFYKFVQDLCLNVIYNPNVLLLSELERFRKHDISVIDITSLDNCDDGHDVSKKLDQLNIYQFVQKQTQEYMVNILENVDDSNVFVYELDYSVSGISSYQKCKRLAKDKPILICDSESVCWLSNLRGNQVKNTPIVFCRGILFPDGTLHIFFSQDVCFTDLMPKNHIKFFVEQQLINTLEVLSRFDSSGIYYDNQSIPCSIFNIIKDKNIFYLNNECLLEKSKKNDKEIVAIKKSHLYDGIALTKLIYWVKNNIGVITEEDVSKHLYSIKSRMQDQSNFVSESFDTISGFAENGAIIHYHYMINNKVIVNDMNKNNFLLIDSGGQYRYGTTDVTRTVVTGDLGQKQKLHYTLVLKGFINLSRAVFPKNVEAKQLDVLARLHLWQYGVDYPHSTGHGVGFFMSVHEHPPSFSMSNPLLKNMVISNEPGIYIEGEYGIRIENLMYVDDAEFVESNNFFCFKQLTIVPIEIEPIDFSILSIDDIKWLYQYQKWVLSELKGYLDNSEYEYFEKNYLCVLEKYII